MRFGRDRKPSTGSTSARATVRSGLAIDSVSPARKARIASPSRTGVFRIVFSLSEGHENAPDLLAKGESCFGVVVHAVAACLGLSPEDADVQRRAYILWSFVHGHSFLTIDMKTKASKAALDDWEYLMHVSRAILRD